jgi:hypothetical protein
MSEILAIRNKFLKNGFVRLPASTMGVGRGEIWFRHVSSSSEVAYVLSLDYKPSAKAYSVYAGVFCLEARSLVEELLPLVFESIAPIYSKLPLFFSRPCWHMFDAGRALNWDSVYVMPNPHQRSLWPNLFKDLFENFLNPVIFKIEDPLEIIDLLMHNDPPFEWQFGVPLLRASEIIALGRVCGVDRDELGDRINGLRGIIEPSIFGPNSYEDIIEMIFTSVFKTG